jgi:hypothetical protein
LARFFAAGSAVAFIPMKAISSRLLLLAGCLALGTPACSTFWPERVPYRDDPLLVARKPVVGKPDDAKPQQLAYAEPSLPSLPAFAYVYPLQRPKLSTDDSALARQKPAPSVPGRLVSRRKTAEPFGHGPDYAWLQGRVYRVASGKWELQFAKTVPPGIGSGRVSLEPSNLLDGVRDGDAVYVEGRLLAERPYTYQVERLSRVPTSP